MSIDTVLRKGGGKGGGGRRGKPGKNGNSQNDDEPKDYSNTRCYKCLEWGHIAKDCNAGPGDTATYANPIVSDGYGAGYAPQYVPAQYTPMAQMSNQTPLSPLPPLDRRQQMQPQQPRPSPHVRQASVHMQQSGPMQALQHNVRQAQSGNHNANGNAPPPGSWNRQYRDPN